MDAKLEKNCKKNNRLVFTEYLLFCVFLITLVLCMSKAIFGIQLSNSPLKHVPIVLFLAAFAFHIMGGYISGASSLNVKGVIYWTWPFFILGLYATIGSLVAKFVLKTEDNFLILGVYLMLTPLFFVWGREKESLSKIISPLISIWGLGAVVSVIGSIVRFRESEPLHEIEFLVLSFFIYTYYAYKSYGLKFLSLILIVLVSILTQKLTGYIIGLFALIYIYIIHIKNTVSPKWRGFIFTVAIILIVLFVGIAIVGFIFFREYFPTGNIEVRLHQYDIVFQSFLESPIWGKAYTGSSGTEYQEYLRSLNVPTHSDILDLLKQGGVVAFALWVIGIQRSFRLLKYSINKNLYDPKIIAYFHAMVFMIITSVFSYAVNPLLLKPPFSFVIWGMLILAVAVASLKKEENLNDEFL